MQIEIKSRLSPQKFKKAVANRTSAKLTLFFNRIQRRMVKIVQIEVRRALNESTEVQSMIYGVLRGELGLTEPKGKLKAIIDRFVNSITVSVRRPRVIGGKIFASLNIGVGAPDYSDILGLPQAKQERTNAKRTEITGEPLQWLRWMLLEGASRIILGYDVVTDQMMGRSSLRYVMQRRRTYWSVPQEFQGYPDNNFLTRAIDARSDIIESRIFALVKNNVR